MAVTDYTTYNDIRAVLGISDEELEDETLALDVTSNRLDMLLGRVATGLPAAWSDAKAAVDAGTPTTLQKRLVGCVQVWASYAVAGLMLTSMRMFAPKKLTDGKGEFDRFTDPWASMKEDIAGIQADTEATIRDILDELGELQAPVTVRVFVGTAGLVENPIVGNGG